MADLQTTIQDLLECLCDALFVAGRDVCACGQTVGAPVLGPSVCCDCSETAGGQLSVTLQRMYPADANTFAQVATVANCRPVAVAADLAFTLARCHPTIDESGNPPTLDEVAEYARGVSEDLQTMWNALQCGCAEHKVVVRDAAVDSDPQGGCSAIGLRVSVLVTPQTPTPAIGS